MTGRSSPSAVRKSSPTQVRVVPGGPTSATIASSMSPKENGGAGLTAWKVLAPGDPDDPIQVIDGRDMASWIIAMIEKTGSGTFHAVSPAPPFSFGDMLEAIVAEVGPPGTTLTWVGEDFLTAEGEDGRSLPLWSAGAGENSINTANPAAAYAAGLSPRPLGQSVREIRDAEASFSTSTTIAPDREADLLSRWRARP